jgi:hypothetical protein
MARNKYSHEVVSSHHVGQVWRNTYSCLLTCGHRQQATGIHDAAPKTVTCRECQKIMEGRK